MFARALGVFWCTRGVLMHACIRTRPQCKQPFLEHCSQKLIYSFLFCCFCYFSKKNSRKKQFLSMWKQGYYSPKLKKRKVLCLHRKIRSRPEFGNGLRSRPVPVPRFFGGGRSRPALENPFPHSPGLYPPDPLASGSSSTSLRHVAIIRGGAYWNRGAN